VLDRLRPIHVPQIGIRGRAQDPVAGVDGIWHGRSDAKLIFYEDDVDKLRASVPVERMLFGSDFPHPEGVAEPLAYLEEFRNYKPDEIKKIFHGNLKGLLEGKRD
jgi:predicted TIM-barrel fold metal-dependent hydrolase